MSNQSPNLQVNPYPSFIAILRLLVQLIALLAILAALLFVPAGRINWVEAWVFIIAYGAFLLLYAIWGLWKDPHQLQERSHSASNTKSWDKVILGVYTICLLMVFIVAGIDAGRYRWLIVPPFVEVLGWLGQIIAGSVIFWAVVTNTYLSRVARIQEDRGQVVVTAGPYNYVRHPMYIGIILLFLSIPIALGSWWALIPGVGIGILFVIRTAKEDQMLRIELSGYEDYLKRVRYRLVPGIW
jgi:protein-S-isoprenylcysteine O-methyltransferase Ste14